MAMIASFTGGAFASGGSSQISMKAALTARGGGETGWASVQAQVKAVGSDQAAAALTSLVATDSPGDAGAAIEASTGGLALGGESLVLSTLQSVAIDTPETDLAFGWVHSFADGETYEVADAAILPIADVVVSNEFDLGTPDFAAVLGIGIGIDFA